VTANSISTIADTCAYTVATSPESTFQTLLTSNASECAADGGKGDRQ
jgi:polar amino acid transport system substrate-binding protein